MIRSQREAAGILVFGAIAISVVLASIPSLPMLTAPSIYTVLFGIVLIALALVSEGIAAFCAFKFFGSLEALMAGRRDATLRLFVSAAVGIIALIGNGALVKIGLNTANSNLVTMEAVYQDRIDANREQAAELRTSILQMQRGETGAMASVFMPQEGETEVIAERDQRTIEQMEERATQLEAQVEADRVAMATITDRPDYLLFLAILVLKFAEVTLVYMASPLARRDLQGAALNGGKRLTNEERIARGMKPLGRPRLVASN
jgi:hypothetical protein